MTEYVSCLAYIETWVGELTYQIDFDAISTQKSMNASSQVVLIADSLCYDEPTVKVDS